MIIAFVLIALFVLLLVALFNPVATMTVLFGVFAGYLAMIGVFWLMVEYPPLSYVLLVLFILAVLYDPKSKKDSSLRGDKETS